MFEISLTHISDHIFTLEDYDKAFKFLVNDGMEESMATECLHDALDEGRSEYNYNGNCAIVWVFTDWKEI